MSHPSSGHDSRGSHSVGEPRRKRPIWLWILLGLIVLALLLLLLSRCGGSDSSSTKKSAGATSSPSPSSKPASPSQTPSPAAGTTSSKAGLTAAGTAVLAGKASSTTGPLTKYTGKPVKATGVSVQSVPADEGFWAGPSATDRVWVQLIGAGESGYSVKQGDTVDFTGTMVRHGSAFADKVGVSAGEGSAQLNREMAHVRVRQGAVSLSK